MQRIGRGKGSQCQQAAADQPVNCAKGQLGGGNLGNAGRPHFQRLFGKPRF